MFLLLSFIFGDIALKLGSRQGHENAAKNRFFELSPEAAGFP
jgi:hypothetical protein